MKKQFTKIKIAAENLSRSSKSENKDFELETLEKQVDKLRDVLEKMVRKLPTGSSGSSGSGNSSNISINGHNGILDTQERDKRIKKQSHYKLGVSLEDSAKELAKEIALYNVLFNCGELEKSIAECTVDNEMETETDIVRRLKLLLDNEIQEISLLKRNVSRILQEYTSLKRSYDVSKIPTAAIRLDEPQSKINNIKLQQEQCELKLEKERDLCAAQMFELIAKEEIILQCVRDYVLNQRYYHERALQKVNESLCTIQDIIQSREKSRFGVSLSEHLASTNRDISYIIELCVCCLIENGLTEEGLLRVGCASTKLRRMKGALETQYIKTPLPIDYQDPHVIGSILKLYLRELPDPLLTYKYHEDFMSAVELDTETQRKVEIKNILKKLPDENYKNVRYLTKFLWLVTQYVEQNKMNSQNLAIVMSPNILWPKVGKNGPINYAGQVNSSSAVNIIVELLISQWDYFFGGYVDFFITLQRNKLFIEDKYKANLCNEHLDHFENEKVIDNSRHGTIRRSKAYAPSPPTKILQSAVCALNTNINGENCGNNNRMLNNDSQTLHQNENQTKLLPISDIINKNIIHMEEPEKPHLPKELSSEKVHVYTRSIKPTPKMRTQFLCMNLENPPGVRKCDENINLCLFKPNLPEKPKIHKRPMISNIDNTIIKGEEEKSFLYNPTVSEAIACIASASEGIAFAHKSAAEKLVEKPCDSFIALQTKNATNNISSMTTLVTPAEHDCLNSTIQIENDLDNISATSPTILNVSINTEKSRTPNSSISSLMIGPKRPTVPAPPPPLAVKKSTTN